MATDKNRDVRPYTFGVTFLFLYFLGLFCFTSILKCGGLNFLVLSGDCEGKPCSSPLGEAIISASRLISVGFCTLLE